MLKNYKLSLLAFFGLLLLTDASAQEKQIQYLSGTDNDHTKTWDFYCTGGRKSGYWTKIEVPSHWEQQGFGAYNYGRDYKTYGKNFRFADEQGFYKTNFNIPAGWNGKKIYIVFEGSMTDTEVRINKKAAGTKHQGAFYEFKYDITNLVQAGSNELDVKVSKMSADESVNNAERLADYWVFGGIFRPVYLEAVPKNFIDHVSIDAKADGRFSMNVFPVGVAATGTIQAEIIDSKGKIVAKTSSVVSAKDSVVLLKTNVSSPATWNAETPNLYKVVVSLHMNGKSVYKLHEKFGFRTIEIRHSDGIYLNGVKIKMKGVNRHVWWPETGRCVNDAIDLADVQLIKGMNMNAVRCSHYPPNKAFLDYCDSLGLYVLDELAGWQKAYSTKAGAPLVKEIVIRDANHPSIIIWSNGNEGGHNKELDDDYGMYDLSNRPVIHAHHRPGNAYNGIDCNHYEDYYSTKKILADSLIYMPTEFLHAQDDGGAAIALNEFWELHWNSKKGAGGFLWALVDEGIVRTDENNIIDVNGLNAPDGIVGPHREKEGSYNAIKEIYSPVKITLKDLPTDFKGDIPLENRYHFTNLSECRFSWSLLNYNHPSDWASGYVVQKSGTAKAPAVAPTASGLLHLELPANFHDFDALELTAFDPHGDSLYTWRWKIKNNETLLTGILKQTDQPASFTETDSTVTLSGGEVSVTFNKKSGLIASVSSKASDPIFFNNGPVLVSGSATMNGFKHYKEENDEVLECSYDGNLKYAKWKMNSSGWISVEYEYTLDGDYPFAGISFNYPENFVLGAKWLGKGPYRVWKNRLQGVTDNVWSNRYNNTQTGSAPWIFPEFKGYYADIVWMELNTVQGKFFVASKDTGLYVRLFDFYGLSGVKPFPQLPVGNISFLDAIPPLGTKLALNISANTAALGPQSELNHIKSTKKRTLYFYFGLPKLDSKPQNFTMPTVNDLF
jgi:hypothetical protein